MDPLSSRTPEAHKGQADGSHKSPGRLARLSNFAPSPAAKAGLKDGDVITRFDGKDVKTYDDFLELLGKKKPDDEVEVVVKRGTESKTFKVVLAKK